MTQEAKKPIWKKRWFRLIIVFIFCSICNRIARTPTTEQPQQQVQQEEVIQQQDPLQERMDAITELYQDEPTFDKVEKIEDGVI